MGAFKRKIIQKNRNITSVKHLILNLIIFYLINTTSMIYISLYYIILLYNYIIKLYTDDFLELRSIALYSYLILFSIIFINIIFL